MSPARLDAVERAAAALVALRIQASLRVEDGGEDGALTLWATPPRLRGAGVEVRYAYAWEAATCRAVDADGSPLWLSAKSRFARTTFGRNAAAVAAEVAAELMARAEDDAALRRAAGAVA